MNANQRYYLKNRDAVLQKQKKFNQSPIGMKICTLKNWRIRGLIDSCYDILYIRYMASTNCDACNKEYINSSDRCMDHDHITGLHRQFLCRKCNNHDSWKKINQII